MQSANFCPQCGTRLERREVGDRVRPVCPACGFIYYMNPVVAAGTLVEQDGRIVLVRRGVEPGKGLWGLPAGYVEADESAEEAAIRETREESGLEVELDGLIGVYSFGKDTGSRGVLILYAAHVVGGTLHAGDDATEVAWFAPDSLPPDDQIAFWTHRQALREWQRARAIRYKLATPEQAAAVRQLKQMYDASERELLVNESMPDGALIVALDRDEVVGYVDVVIGRSEHQAWLRRVFVLPNHRRWGIGTRLIERAIAFAREHKISRLLAEVDPGNVGIGAYLKAGFRACGFLDPPCPQNGAHLCGPVLILAHDLSSDEGEDTRP
ncbi:MAG: GNAT family N-acetyltransferase [Chloroflexi bacterium]|nr:GNAT family N-acetyltransferase [Chloroflexota bacterium]